MSRGKNPWQPFQGYQGQVDNELDLRNNREARENLAQEIMAELGFKNCKPPAPNLIAERAYSQLTFEQLAQVPQLIIRHEPWESLAEVARDCQIFANKYREACFIADEEGRVLVYRDPQTAKASTT